MKMILSIMLCPLLLLTAAQAETCSDKMKKIIKQKDSSSYLSGAFSNGYPGGVSIDVTWLAKPFLRIRAKKATSALAVLTDAAKEGGGPATKALWDKLNGKNHQYEKRINYDQFVKAIHSADLKGTQCADDEVLKRYDFQEIAVDENKQCEVNAQNSATKELKKFCDETIQKIPVTESH